MRDTTRTLGAYRIRLLAKLLPGSASFVRRSVNGKIQSTNRRKCG